MQSENTSSKKRTTLLKKTSQSATLCDTDALLIIFENDPTDPGSHPIQFHMWPESPDEFNRILNLYRDYCGSNGLEPKWRKIEDVSADDASVLLGLVDWKLSMVESRLRELEGNRIQCCGGSPEEPPYVPVAVDVCSNQEGSGGLEDNMFACGAVGS